MRAGRARAPARGGFFMWGIIGAVLLLMWLLGFFAFHVTVGFVHILLVLAVISILYHFVAGRSATV
jgi:hypothetical protein